MARRRRREGGRGGCKIVPPLRLFTFSSSNSSLLFCSSVFILFLERVKKRGRKNRGRAYNSFMIFLCSCFSILFSSFSRFSLCRRRIKGRRSRSTMFCLHSHIFSSFPLSFSSSSLFPLAKGKIKEKREGKRRREPIKYDILVFASVFLFLIPLSTVFPFLSQTCYSKSKRRRRRRRKATCITLFFHYFLVFSSFLLLQFLYNPCSSFTLYP